MTVPDDVLLAYITCANLEEARRIGRAVVEQGLTACADIPGHETVYAWQGAVRQGHEVGLLTKTTRASYPALQQRGLSLHSHSLPCMFVWPPQAGLQGYLDWIAAEVAEP